MSFANVSMDAFSADVPQKARWRTIGKIEAHFLRWISLTEGLSMTAYLVLLLAALSRLVPHAMHGVGLNFTAVGAGLLFFGSRRSRWQAMIAAVVMAITDVYLTTVVYGMHFQVASYLTTWIWYAAVCLIGSSLLQKVTAARVVGGILASASGFFLLSNFMVWTGGAMYSHTFSGLIACYGAGLPFYGNDLASTGLVAGVLFGLPALAARLVRAMRSADAPRPA